MAPENIDAQEAESGTVTNGLTPQAALAKAEALEHEAALLRAAHGLEPLYAFPEFGTDDEGRPMPAGHHVDRKTKTFWAGFKIQELDYNRAKDFMRTCDFQIGSLYYNLMKQQESRSRLGAAPAGGLVGLVRKAASALAGRR